MSTTASAISIGEYTQVNQNLFTRALHPHSWERDMAEGERTARYRRFFQECDTDYVHDGTTRNAWVDSMLVEILEEPQASGNAPPDTFPRVIRTLMDQGDKKDADPGCEKAMALLNVAFAREGYEAFYAEDRQCYLKHIADEHDCAARSKSPPTFLGNRPETTRWLTCLSRSLFGR